MDAFDLGYVAGYMGLSVELNPFSVWDVESFTLWDTGHLMGEMDAINSVLAVIAVEVLEVELEIMVF